MWVPKAEFAKWEVHTLQFVKFEINYYSISSLIMKEIFCQYQNFRCEKFEENGSVSLYKFYKLSSKHTWAQAQNFCNKMGEHLPSFHSLREWNMFVWVFIILVWRKSRLHHLVNPCILQINFYIVILNHPINT